jgi:PAS domain S-box-containing protein
VLANHGRALVETFPFPAWVKDLQSRFVSVNRRFAETAGVAEPADLLGRTDFDIWPADLASRYVDDDKAVLKDGTPRLIEEAIEHQGARVWFESFKAPVKATDGSVVGTYGFSREITDRKRAQSMVELQRDLGLALAEAPDAEHAYAALLDHALRLPGIEASGLYEVRSDGAFVLRAHRGLSNDFVARVNIMPADVPEVLASRSGLTLRASRDFGPSLWEALRNEGLREVVVLPISDEGQVRGCLNLASRTHDRIADDVVIALEAMGVHVGQVLERLRAQGALRESEARWGFALEGAGDGVWDWDVPGGKVFYSRRWKEMLGYSEDEIGNDFEEWSSRVHPDDRGNVEGEPGRHYRRELSSFSTEHRLRRKDGSYTWVLDRGRVVEWAADGAPLRVIGIQSDISERKRADAALRESAEFLRDVIASTSDGIFVDDNQGHVLIANERFSRLWRIAPELLATMDERAIRASVLDQLEDPAGFQARVAELSGTDREALDLIAFADGRRFERRSCPLMREGKVAGRVWSFLDVTQRVLADERLAQAEKLEAIGLLTGGLAHDFNNILGIVLGSIDLAATSPREEWRELLSAARKAAERGAEVTRALLAIARRQELSPGTVDVNASIHDLLPLLAQTAGKRVTLTFDPWAGPVRSHLDPGGFNNAMLNLVLNARDAMPEGGEIHIRTAVITLGAEGPAPLPAGRFNLVEVRDTGVGMPPDVAARAFDPFFTTKGRGKGTGLGLAMVYGFARQSGGTAVIRSSVSRGSVVQLYLPVLSEERAAADTPRVKDATAAAGGHERVLLVDDEPALLDVARRWLTDLGYLVTAVSSPGEALAFLAERSADVLVSDVIMPGQMDGVDLATEVERRWPGMAILLISGYPEGLVEKIQGRWMLLDKPFTRDQLDRMIRATVAGGCGS